MRWLRTNTACRVTVGPFLDKTDGITPETGLTVTNCHLTLLTDVANVPTLVLDTTPTASGGNNDMVHVTGDDAGFYDLELTATNTNNLGRAMLALTDAANHCPVFHEFMILPAMIYDSLVLGTDRLDTNVTHIGDTSQTARDVGLSVLLSSGTGTGQLSLSSGAVLLQATQIGVTIPTVTTVTNAPSDSSGTTSLLSRVTSTRAGYLDNLATGDAYSALTSTLPDSTPTDGTRPNALQALLMIARFLTERSVSGTTMTIKKEDGSTPAFICTLNDGTSPTSVTRSS